jgi:ribosome biogenesis GTPase
VQAFPAGLGRQPDFDLTDLTPARVLAANSGRWLVATPGGEPQLVPARRLEETPVTGDWVALDDAGAIAGLFPRRGTIVRRAPGEPTESQTLAAHVDLALIVEAFPDPNERRIERLVAITGDVPAVLVLTKADLADDAQLAATQLARRLGVVDAVAVSARAGDGLGVLLSLLGPGDTTILLGPSGAGKSTLVNALLGEDRQATGAVREGDGRGRHTTVTRELLSLPGGALLIDTPGVREAGLWDGAGETFPDIEALALQCRFANCEHRTEPGCAVRGVIEPERLEAWRKLQVEQAWVDERRSVTSRRR